MQLVIPAGLLSGLHKKKGKQKEDQVNHGHEDFSEDDHIDINVNQDSKNQSSGWTYILRDWFEGLQNSENSTSNQDLHKAIMETFKMNTGREPTDHLEESFSAFPSEENLHSYMEDDSHKQHRNSNDSHGELGSPYFMVAKHRLMGIFIAVFGHREMIGHIRGEFM